MPFIALLHQSVCAGVVAVMHAVAIISLQLLFLQLLSQLSLLLVLVLLHELLLCCSSPHLHGTLFTQCH